MGTQQSTEKEETVIVQNAAGGTNGATVSQLMSHASTTNIMLGIICGMLLLGGFYYMLKCYKRTHVQWVQRELNNLALRRSIRLQRVSEPVTV